jgi:hypothetical protein
VIRYLNLPKIPNEILNNLNYEFTQYSFKSNFLNGAYKWSDSFNQEIDAWCKQNICDTMHWGFQFMNSDIVVHKDVGTEVKLTYLIDAGGANVRTNFFEDDKTTMTHSFVIPIHRWHILCASKYHSVEGIESKHTRFSLTGRVFPLPID